MAALSAPSVQEEQQAERRLRYQLAAAVRSINWSYAIFWSISSTQPGVLMWTDGFYNGEVKTRKISNTTELTDEQLVMQRSEQLRELYEALLSGECARRAEDLGDTEWYYVVSMTYAFRPNQGLPGKSFASNEHVWLCNAHLAGSKVFPRALLAKSASIKTIVCIPLMSGVLELGTTDAVPEDPGLVSRATGAFWELPYPTCSQEPSSNPSPNEAADIIVFEDLDHSAMDRMLAAEEQEQVGEDESLSNASLERITKEIDEFYGLFKEMDVQPLEDSWAMDGSFEVPSSPPPQQTPGVAADDGAASSAPVDGSRATSFTAWARSESDSDEVAAVPVIEEPQKLLKKVVAGGAWAANNGGGGGGTATRATQESGIKNHVMSERERREKLNEMFLILKSMVPSIHKKVDKASILAETIAYLKELQRRVQELESSSRELISSPSETTRLTRRPDSEVVGKKVSAGSKRKGSELGHDDMEREHPWTLSKDGTSNVTVTVSDKEVLLEVQCRWEELLMTRVFDAIKSLHLDFFRFRRLHRMALWG